MNGLQEVNEWDTDEGKEAYEMSTSGTQESTISFWGQDSNCLTSSTISLRNLKEFLGKFLLGSGCLILIIFLAVAVLMFKGKLACYFIYFF